MRISALIIALSLSLPQPALSLEVQVLRVIDGDTIVIEGGQRVRYIGIDAPEMAHPRYGRRGEPFGEAARRFNEKLVLGRRVRLEFDVEREDRYGRLLAYVWVPARPSGAGGEDALVNAELVRAGLAEARRYPPNLKYAKRLEQLEREARLEGRGMWGREEGEEILVQRWRQALLSLVALLVIIYLAIRRRFRRSRHRPR